MRPHATGSLLAGLLLILSGLPSQAAPQSVPVQSGSTEYYDWALYRTAPSPVLPTPSPGTQQQDWTLDAAKHFVAADSWGAAGNLRQLNSAVPVTIRWDKGEAWASPTQRFTCLVLVAIDANPLSTSRPYLLRPNEEITIHPANRTLFAFFPDLDAKTNNRGTVRLALHDRSNRRTTLEVDARLHAIDLTATNALPVTLVPQRAATITATRAAAQDHFRNAPLRHALVGFDSAAGRDAAVISDQSRSPVTIAPTAATGALCFIGAENVTNASGTMRWQVRQQAQLGYFKKGVRTNQPIFDATPPAPGRSGYELRLSQISIGSMGAALIPVALSQVYAGDQFQITGTLPVGTSVAALRLYDGTGSSSGFKARATCVSGSLAVTALSAADQTTSRWDELLWGDFSSDALLAAGQATSRQRIPAGTPFRVTLDVAPYRDGRRGNPHTLYLGLAVGPDEFWVSSEARSTYEAAAALPPIPLTTSSGWYQD